ncbi:unnamed protein product [Boreogadus saida]
MRPCSILSGLAVCDPISPHCQLSVWLSETRDMGEADWGGVVSWIRQEEEEQTPGLKLVHNSGWVEDNELNAAFAFFCYEVLNPPHGQH